MQTARTSAEGGPGERIGSAQFAELFASSYGKLCGLASVLVDDRTEAEDLVQDAAMVAFKKLDQFTAWSHFSAWMARIVRMHAANWRRKKAGRRTSAADPVDLDKSQTAAGASPATHSVAEAAAGDTRGIEEGFDDLLLQNLQRVDEVPRACLLLRVVHELAYDEIADMLEIPSGTAMSYVHRTKKRLRDAMVAQAEQDSNQREG